MGPKWDLAAIAKITRQGAGRMPGFPNLSDAEVTAVSQYVLSGESKPIEADEPAAVTLDYRFTGYRKFLDPEGYPAIAPPWGTLNAIDLNTGEIRLEDPVRRISGTGGEGNEGYGQRELWRPGRHRGRAGLHRRHELRPQASGLR